MLNESLLKISNMVYEIMSLFVIVLNLMNILFLTFSREADFYYDIFNTIWYILDKDNYKGGCCF